MRKIGDVNKYTCFWRGREGKEGKKREFMNAEATVPLFEFTVKIRLYKLLCDSNINLS